MTKDAFFKSIALQPKSQWVHVEVADDPRMESLVCPKCDTQTLNPKTRWINSVSYNGYGGSPAYMEVVCGKCWYVDKIYEWERVYAPWPTISDIVWGGIMSVFLIGLIVGIPILAIIMIAVDG
jgi:hypothetical protein